MEEQLRVVQSFIAGMPPVPRGAVSPFLQSVRDLGAQFSRKERRVTIFGATKTGKSSLLNALLGAGLLPTRPYRRAGTVTTVRYGSTPRLTVLREGEDEREMPFDSYRDLEWDAAAGTARDVHEIRIAVPLPLLAQRVELVDTPGLLGEQELSERAYREIEKADLAMMVLAADKILSAKERAIVGEIDDLLNGNIVFIVNRMDLIEDEDREDVLAWVRAALRDCGNAAVGHARIFVTALPRCDQPAGVSAGAGDVRSWLTALFAGESGDRVAAISRLGILDQRLVAARAHLCQELDDARSRASATRTEHAQATMTERARRRRAIADATVRLQAVRAGLDAVGERFVRRAVADTSKNLDRHGPGDSVPVRLEAALLKCQDDISGMVALALSEVEITIPQFDLSGWIIRLSVTAPADAAAKAGLRAGDLLGRVVRDGGVGREGAAAIGEWVGKNLLHADVEAETLNRVAGLSRNVLESVRREAESHVDAITCLLDDADSFYQSWTRASATLAQVENDERGWQELLHWCDGFMHAIHRALDEAASGGANE
ncbi:MAG: dynamin family protein [Chloroflexota bacterium]